jgi:ADP-ribose pyrophosphatase YjhB (NUDIX family)
MENIDMHSVGGLISNKENQIIIQYHNKYRCWTIPMGKVENGLTLTETLRKELTEEIGIKVDECEEVASKMFIYNNINPIDWTVQEGGKTYVVLFHLFRIIKWNGEVKNNEPQKHSEIKFVNLDSLHTIKPISDALKVFFEYINEDSER